jgi:hypothetical protein
VGDKIKEDEMSRTCNTHGEKGNTYRWRGRGRLMERGHFVDLGVDGRIMLE